MNVISITPNKNKDAQKKSTRSPQKIHPNGEKTENGIRKDFANGRKKRCHAYPQFGEHPGQRRNYHEFGTTRSRFGRRPTGRPQNATQSEIGEKNQKTT